MKKFFELYDVYYRDGIKSTEDKTGMVVGATKCIGG